MKKLSASRLAQVVSSQRKSLKMTQKQLAKDAGISAVRDEYEAKMKEQQASYEAKIEALNAQIVAACDFTDDQKYTVRLNAERRAMQKDYDTKLAEATKKAKKFVKKARVLVDDKPQALLNLPEAEDYK